MRGHTIFGGVLVAIAVKVGNVSCTASSHVERVAATCCSPCYIFLCEHIVILLLQHVPATYPIV